MTHGAGELDARAEELRAARTPFVAATVVQAERPTSAKPGDAALVLADGTVVGFVGGECAATSVQVEALAALAREEPVLLRITPDDGANEARPGTVTVHNPCLSGGTLEIFLEPSVPPPLVVVHGDAPIARALADVAGPAGYAVERWSGAALPADATAVIVASHGRDEGDVIREALGAGVPYVGLVASPRRGGGVLDALGLSDDERARVHTPAGLDIGARTPGEVAVSILAEIVSVRPRRPRPAGPGGEALAAGETAGSPPTATDPVCGMTVACTPAALSAEHDGSRWWFCGSGCRDAFRSDPGVFRAPVSDPIADVDTLLGRLDDAGYLADRGLATALFLAARLPQPLLLEGEAGVGKTEAAKALARVLGAPLLRLQCYEGIDAAEALYEWDYPRQLLAIRLAEARGGTEGLDLFTREFLVARPLLQAVEHPGPVPAVLLIDEIDRADDEFEAFLFEMLAEQAVTIPELGTVTATVAPIVVLTSNRTRDLHDALKRRCLYHWIDYPSFERTVAIVRRRVPSATMPVVEQAAAAVARLRSLDVQKLPGVAETIDWVSALTMLGLDHLAPDGADATLGSVLKYREDLDVARARGLEWLTHSGP